jgi:hypothetical protein
MKRILSVLFIACVAMLFVSCQKEGVYNPSKKISKIYYTSYSGIKSLEQVWTWNKDNTLQKIDYYDDGAIDYTYNFTYEKKRLVRMNDYANNCYVEYKYDKNLLKEANYYVGGTLCDAYTFTYKNGKIVKVTDNWIGSKGGAEKAINPLRFIFSEELCDAIDQSQKRMGNVGGKATLVYVYELTWDKDNVSKMVTTVSGSSATQTYEMSYDKMNNPFYRAYLDFYFEDNASSGCLSKNNITRIEAREVEEDGDVWTGSVNYEYTYEGKYPTSLRYANNYGISSLTEYEYLK